MDHFWEQGQRTGRARAAYAPECVEGEFSELGTEGVLGSAILNPVLADDAILLSY